MQFRYILSAILIAISLCSSYVAGAAAADLFSLPACFSSCASKAVTDVGCKDLNDATCYCAKEDFVKANGRCTIESCGELAMNTTITNASFNILESICKKAIGHKFNLTVPTLSELGLNGSTTVPTSGTTASSRQGATTTTTDSVASLQPPMAHLLSAALVFSALLAGSSLLL